MASTVAATPATDEFSKPARPRTLPQNGLDPHAAGASMRGERLFTPEQVAERLNVSVDWVRDHSSRKKPRLPVIRLGAGPGRKGLLRYRPDAIEQFIDEMEQAGSDGRRVK